MYFASSEAENIILLIKVCYPCMTEIPQMRRFCTQHRAIKLSPSMNLEGDLRQL